MGKDTEYSPRPCSMDFINSRKSFQRVTTGHLFQLGVLKFFSLFQTCEFFLSDLNENIQAQTIRSIRCYNKGSTRNLHEITDLDNAFLLIVIIKIYFYR